MALEFVLGRVRRDIRLNGSFMAHCCPTTSFRPMAGKAELCELAIRQVSERISRSDGWFFGTSNYRSC